MEHVSLPRTDGEWCESVVDDWLRRSYSSVCADRKHFPDFIVDGRLAVEVTGLHPLEPDGDTSVLTAQRTVRAILASALPEIPFHAAYGPRFLAVEYDLSEPPNRRVLLRELRAALVPYAAPGQELHEEPFLHLPSGVRLGFLPGRSRPGHSSSRLSIGVEMPREGCLPDEELRRAMARALRTKTPKAESWRRRYPRCECWLACVDRIGTCLFEDTRDTVIAGWRASLSIPDVWDRLILFPMTHLTRRAAGVVPVDVLHRLR